MTNTYIIPDSSIFTKLFHNEAGSHEANAFIKACIFTNSKLIVPEQFKFEIISITRKHNESIANTLELYEALKETILTVVMSDSDIGKKAKTLSISKAQHNKSNTFHYLCIYHALAISTNHIFLTADRMYYDRYKQYDHIEFLGCWENIFTTFDRNRQQAIQRQ